MDHKHLVPCPLCGETNSKSLFNAVDRMHGVEGTFPLHQCQNCSLVYLAQKFSPEEIASFYPDHYYSYQAHDPAPHVSKWKERELAFRTNTEAIALHAFLGYPAPKQASWAARTYARIRKSKYANAYPPFKKNGKLLDVGCGSGDFLLKMEQLGWEACGVEPGTGAHAAKQRGLDVFHGTLEQAAFPDKHFDHIRFEHVLEHVPNPLRTLAEAKRILAEKGSIRLLVPNWASLPARWFQSFWYHLDAPRHLIWFTPATINAIAQKAGLHVTSLRITPDYSDISDSLIYLLRENHPHLANRLAKRKALWKACNKLTFPLRLWMRLTGSGSLLHVTLSHASETHKV